MFGLDGLWKKLWPYLTMIFLQVGYAGMYVIVLLCIKQGMSHFALIIYRNGVGALVMAPFALWFERKGRTKMTPRIFLQIVGLAILEPVIDQNLGYMGANFTSAAFTSELNNIVPAVTFIIAIILRMETMRIRSTYSQAKIGGAILTVVGALVMILYKGPIIEFFWSKGRNQDSSSSSDPHHWLIGTFMVLTSSTCWSIFYILQSNTLKVYPEPLTLTTLICFMGSLFTTAIGIVFDHNVKSWEVGWDKRLITCIYSGIFCSGLTYYLQGLVMKERGPVFTTAFNPLTMIITAILGSIILAEKISLGMIIGAIFLVIGLYSLLWGKSKEMNNQIKENGIEKNGELKLPVATSDVEIPEVTKS